VRLSTHAIGNYEQIQGRHDAESIFIVGALLPDIALSIADNAHKSPFPDGRAKRGREVHPDHAGTNNPSSHANRQLRRG
jgi:hypothetical protein